jgi:hypothetical protein
VWVNVAGFAVAASLVWLAGVRLTTYAKIMRMGVVF